VEVLGITGSTTLNISVEHKNLDETTWVELGAFTGITAVDIGYLEASSIREELRFKFSVSGTNNYDAAYFNVLAPQWRP
jgi:hypothetical protein